MSSRTSPEQGLLAGSTALKALLDSSSDLLAVLQADRTLSYTNQSFLRVLGYATSEILGHTLEKLHHPAELNRMAQQFAKAEARAEQKVSGRCRLRSKEGSWLWFDFEISNHLGTAGMDALLVSFRNVTDLRRLEAERQVISDVVHALNQTSNLDQLLRQIHCALRKVVHAENCFVALHEPVTDMFHFAFFVDQFDPPPPPKKIASTCMDYVFRTGDAQLSHEQERIHVSPAFFAHATTDLGFRYRDRQISPGERSRSKTIRLYRRRISAHDGSRHSPERRQGTF
jgi:PAS domain S-box-containing protein